MSCFVHRNQEIPTMVMGVRETLYYAPPLEDLDMLDEEPPFTVTSVVTSVDLRCTKYVADLHVQKPPIANNLKGMFVVSCFTISLKVLVLTSSLQEMIKMYMDYRNTIENAPDLLPRRLLIFRSEQLKFHFCAVFLMMSSRWYTRNAICKTPGLW